MKKYIKGKKINTMKRFMELFREQKPVWRRHKYVAMGFIENWPLKQIEKSIKAGVLFEVKKIKKEGDG